MNSPFPSASEFKPFPGRRGPQPAIDLVVLAAFCALFFFYGLGAIGLTGADEPRYAQIAREMLARHDWVTPILYGKPWLEKPVLYYWEAMISYRLLGVSDWAARLPSAADATVLVVAVYLFVRRAWRTPLALDAALITASCAFVIGFGHGASTDMPLAATFSIAMLAWLGWWAEVAGRGQTSPSGSWLLALFYLFLGLGTLAKGPVAPFLAAMIIGVFAAVRRDLRAIRQTLWLPGILVFLAVTLPWYLLVQLRTGNFFRVFILEHNLERFGTPVFRHTQPFWYYGIIVPLALVPWTALALAGWVEAIRGPGIKNSAGPSATDDNRRGEADINLLLVLWGTLPVLFFSLSESKLPGYILPAMPAWTLLAAGYLRRKLLKKEPPHCGLVLAHGLILGATLAVVLLAPYHLLHLAVPRPVLMIAIVAGAFVFTAVVFTVVRFGLRTLRVATVLPMVLGLILLLRVSGTAVDPALSARPLAHELARLAPATTPVAVFGTSRELDYGLAFYRNAPVIHYAADSCPAEAHLLITHAFELKNILPYVPGRVLKPIGDFRPQGLEIYWVSGKADVDGRTAPVLPSATAVPKGKSGAK